MAAGDSLLVWIALGTEAPSANYGTLDTRNLHPMADFDDTTNESIILRGIMPQQYGGNGIDVILHVSMTSAVSGDTDWDCECELIGVGDQDLDSDGFAAANSTDNTTVPGTSGHVQQITIAFTDGADMDSITAGDQFRLRITRDAVSDTAAGDAEITAVELRETA